MKKIFLLFVLSILISACGITRHEIGSISLLSNVTQTSEKVEISNLDFGKGKKEGRACGRNLLYILAEGDISIETAKKNGGISTITSVNKEIKNYVLFSEVCTIVRGY